LPAPRNPVKIVIGTGDSSVSWLGAISATDAVIESTRTLSSVKFGQLTHPVPQNVAQTHGTSPSSSLLISQWKGNHPEGRLLYLVRI
jgi:hypothetical protein